MTLNKSDSEAFQSFEHAGWERTAAKYHAYWGGLTSQSSEALNDATKVVEGNRVLDVATGAGYVAATAAKRGANVTGLDFSGAQVDLARKTYPGIEFVEGSADDLPFPKDEFDVVLMGFGMLHMPDASAAIREAYRVLKPGGTYGFTVWQEPQPGQGFGIVMPAVEEFGVPASDLPPAPPYFEFADPIKVVTALGSAGFNDISTETVPQFLTIQNAGDLFEAFYHGAVRASALLQAQPADKLERIKTAIRDEVEKLASEDGFVIPFPAALSTGRKPVL